MLVLLVNLVVDKISNLNNITITCTLKTRKSLDNRRVINEKLMLDIAYTEF